MKHWTTAALLLYSSKIGDEEKLFLVILEKSYPTRRTQIRSALVTRWKFGPLKIKRTVGPIFSGLIQRLKDLRQGCSDKNKKPQQNAQWPP